jgi:hypothetical protein
MKKQLSVRSSGALFQKRCTTTYRKEEQILKVERRKIRNF